MVIRTFSARDNEAFVVDSSSPFMTDGSAVINNSNTPIGTIFVFAGGWPLEIITIDDQGGDPDVLEDDQSGSHTIVDGGNLITSGHGIEAESFHTFRELDANGVAFGPEITIAVYSKDGVTSDVWGFISFSPLTPGARYVKISGSNDGTQIYDDLAPCFTTGTRIKTSTGYKNVEDISVGDTVWARGDENARVIWMASSEIPDALNDAPILFPANTFGNDEDFLVSPQHRIVIDQERFPKLWHIKEAFVPAKYFVGYMGVKQVACEKRRYHHILLEKHSVLESNGVFSESFFPGPCVMRGFSLCAQLRLVDAIRSVRARNSSDYGPLALPCLNRAQADILFSRSFAKTQRKLGMAV